MLVICLPMNSLRNAGEVESSENSRVPEWFTATAGRCGRIMVV